MPDCGAAGDCPLLAIDEAGGAGGVGNGAAELLSAGGLTALFATLLSAGALFAVEEGAEDSGTGTEPLAVAWSASRLSCAV